MVELSFYAVLPLWFLVGERLARGRPLRTWAGRELAALAALSVVSVLAQLRRRRRRAPSPPSADS